MNGIYVTSMRTITMTAKSGSIFFDVASSDVFPTAHPTKRAEPTGGVQSPIARLKISMIPKWTVLMSNVWTTGSRIGVMIMMSGAISMKHPRIISRMLMMRRMTYGLSENPMRPFVIAIGILRRVIMYAKALADAISVRTTASVLSEFLMTFPKSLIFAALNTKYVRMKV